MDWRPAKSLVVLRNQLDAEYPGWLFLGYKGDAAHAAVPSDHNPNSAGVVCALDIGPGGGLDIHKLADNIVAKPHPNLKYIISNRRIANWQTGFKWEYYGGGDPHDTHIHVSVGRGPDGQSVQPYDDTIKWNIGGEMTSKSTAIMLVRTLTHEHSPSEAIWSKWVGLDDAQLKARLDNVYASAWFKEHTAKIKAPTEYVPVTEQLYKEKV